MILGLLMTMPACIKRQQPLPVSEIDRQIVDPAPLDIPTPVSIQLYAYPVLSEATHIYGFPVKTCSTNLKNFYELSMAEVGWQQESCVQSASEVVFVFKKPRKWCTLVLEQHRVRFYVSVRKKK